MLLTPHGITGLVVAKYEPDLLPAVLAVVTLHFVLDYIPHTDMIGGEHVNKGNIILRSIDLLVLVLCVFLLVPAHRWLYSSVVVLFAILPDIIEIPGLVWKKWRNIWGISQFHHWHTETLQYSWGKVSWFWGLLPQVVLVAVCGWILLV